MQKRLTGPKLIAFLGGAESIVMPGVLARRHAGYGSPDQEFFGIAESPLPGHFLPVALQLQNLEIRGFRDIVKMPGAFEAGNVRLSILELRLVFQTIDFTEDRSLAQLQLGFGQVGHGLLQVGRAFFGISAVLLLALIHLVAQVLILALRVARVVYLLGPFKFRQDVALFHRNAGRHNSGQRHVAALAVDLRNPHGERVDGLNGAVRSHHLVQTVEPDLYPSCLGAGLRGDGRRLSLTPNKNQSCRSHRGPSKAWDRPVVAHESSFETRGVLLLDAGCVSFVG